MNKIAQEGNQMLKASWEALQEKAAAYRHEVEGLVGAYGTLAASQAVLNSETYKYLYGGMEKASLVPKQIAAEMIGANVLLTEKTKELGNLMQQNALELQKEGYDDQRQIVARQQELASQSGQQASLLYASIFGNAADLGKSFYAGVMADTRLFSAAMESISTQSAEHTFKMKETTELVVKGMGVDVTTINALYEEEFAKTGKISGDYINEFASSVVAASKITGIGTTQLAADMEKMIKDVEKFGNMTKSEMLSLSATVHQLGLDMNDVAQVAGKFSAFEGASQAISNIGAITGATLDTMELFYLANEDKEEFFKSMKQQLLDQGVTLENLSHQEQVYLSKQLGFSSVRQLQTLLNEDIDATTENLTAQIDAVAAEQENVGDNLTKQLMQMGGLADETIKALDPKTMQEALGRIRDLTGGTADFAEAAIGFRSQISGIADEALPALVGAATTSSSMFASEMGKIIKKLDEFRLKLEEFAKNGVPKEMEPGSVPETWRPIIVGLDFLHEEMNAKIGNLSGDAQKGLVDAGKATAARIQQSVEGSAAQLEAMRASYKAKIEEINKFETELAASQAAKLKEADKVQDALKNATLGLDLTPEKALERVKGVVGPLKSLTEKELADITAGLMAGKTDAIATAVIGDSDAKIKDFYAKLGGTPTATPAAPTAPEVPGTTPAGGTTPTPAAGREAPEAPAAAGSTSGIIDVKIRLDIDKSALEGIIKADILPEIVMSTITLPRDSAGRPGGTVRFVTEAAG